jgi:hypothetical protein
MENQDEGVERTEVDALCRECGHAFKTYVDRLIPPDMNSEKNESITCPVCGCGECNIGK